MFHYKGKMMEAPSSNTDLHGRGEEIRAEIGRRIPKDRNLKVLDVGTGFGISVAFLARWLSKGSALWTVDPSEEVLSRVEASLDGERAGKVGFTVGSAEDLGFEDGFFDFVVSVMVLHHIERLQPALEEMSRVLKPGGRLLVVDYKPEASRELEFMTRHEERDFFAPRVVAKGVGRMGMEVRSSDHELWYLVEAKKPVLTRHGRAAGEAGGEAGPRTRPYRARPSTKRAGIRSSGRHRRRGKEPRS